MLDPETCCVAGGRNREAGGGWREAGGRWRVACGRWWVPGAGCQVPGAGCRVPGAGGPNRDIGRYHSQNNIFSTATATRSYNASR